MKFFYYLIRALVYIPVKIVFPVKVHNKKLFPKRKKVIVISNHLCWRDALLVAVNFPGYRHFLGKKELGKNWFVRFIAKITGIIFVERGKTDLATMRTIVDKIKKGNGLNLFPEGTRNKVDTNLQEIKSGAVMFSIRGQAPFVPIYIDRVAKPFRKTHICVGELFDLTNNENKSLSSSSIKEKVEIITMKMKAVKDQMDMINLERSKKKKSKNKDTSYNDKTDQNSDLVEPQSNNNIEA